MVRNGPTELSPLALDLWQRTAPALRDASAFVVALSGGLDSSVLLALLDELRRANCLGAPLEAIHVHHGLQAEAEAWVEHCRKLCSALQIPLHVVQAQVDSQGSGMGLEAAARDARYRIFTELLPQDAVLLQGHHADDQCETLLLHLLRGSGLRGLAGMPRERVLGRGRLLRPLLHYARDALLAHARARALTWIEDPSNADTELDRNYLRHAVLPRLRQRWPSLAASLGRSTELLGESNRLLDELAASDLAQVRASSPRRLNVAAVRGLSEARRRNLLRYWVRRLYGDAAGIPGRILRDGLHSLLDAAQDRNPLLAWTSAVGRLELRRFRGELFLLDASPPGAMPELEWSADQVLSLPAGLGTLALVTGAESVIPGTRLEVRWRKGGERMRLARRGTHTLKNLLQEQGIPVWWRDRLPLVFGAGELLVVPGLFESEHWPAFIGSRDAQIVWRDADLH